MEQDPVVLKRIGKKNLYIRQSHQLPKYLESFPFYDRALPRISKVIKEIDGYLSVIDIGANIGDTVALITDEVQGDFLCIEGDQEFASLLKRNVKKFKNSYIIIEESFCSDKDQADNSFKMDRKDGTAKFMELEDKSNAQSSIQFKKLDTIIDNHKDFKKTNLLKIDTDGFEINILKGATSILKAIKPNLFLEFSAHMYMDLEQNPLDIFHILKKFGYKKALLYDNFGKPFEIIDTADDKRILELIALVDNEKIYYYDILTYHESKEKKYAKLFEKELFSSLSVFNSELEKSNNNLTIALKDSEIASLQLTQDKKELDLANGTLVEKQKELYINTVELDKKKMEFEAFKTKLDQAKASQLNADAQYYLIRQEINKIYRSRTWKLVLSLRKVLKFILPSGSKRRELIKSIWNFIKHIKKQLRESLKNLFIYLSIPFYRLNKLLPFKKKRSINTTSKKIVYIDHSYHQKTESTFFLINYLKQFYDVKVIWDDSWQGLDYPDLSFVDDSYHGVIFFQNLPTKEIYDRIKNTNLIFFPMYDSHGGFSFTYWKQYRNLKIINFSRTLHEKLKNWGFDSMYIQYFLKPRKFFKGKKNNAFFYYRSSNINIETVKTLIGNQKVKLHIHRTPDPTQELPQPTKDDEKKYSITYSDWLKKREDELKIERASAIYFAPREFEGIGIGFLEALTFGKVVIAVDNPTMNEYIKHNVTGYLYKLNNPRPIDFSNSDKIQKNTYEYMKKGYEEWEKNKHRIIDYIVKR